MLNARFRIDVFQATEQKIVNAQELLLFVQIF
jgi:hypothetical protein